MAMVYISRDRYNNVSKINGPPAVSREKTQMENKQIKIMRNCHLCQQDRAEVGGVRNKAAIHV